MDVNGCHIVSTLCADNPEGFSSSVARGEVIRGPFATIREAVECAMAWKVVSEVDPGVTSQTVDAPSDVLSVVVPESTVAVDSPSELPQPTH